MVVIVQTLVTQKVHPNTDFVPTYLNYTIFNFLIEFFYFNIVNTVLVGDHFCYSNHCVVLTLLFVLGPLHVWGPFGAVVVFYGTFLLLFDLFVVDM